MSSSQGDRAPGWLVRIADQKLSSSQGSEELSHSQSMTPPEEDSLSQLSVESLDYDASQSSQPKPGEKGWLVALAEKSSDSALAAKYQQERRRSLTSSQDRVSNASSQGQTRRASSSAFEPLGSQAQETLSQLSNLEQPDKPSETLDIMAVPETESVFPGHPVSLESELFNDLDSPKNDAAAASSLAGDTLAQECSDIIRSLKPVPRPREDTSKGSTKLKVPKFKAAPKKKAAKKKAAKKKAKK